MAVYERPVAYRIILERGGREIDHEICLTADKANKVAILMLLKHGDVRDGDTLKVTEHR